jgi:hypothetical protein
MALFAAETRVVRPTEQPRAGFLMKNAKDIDLDMYILPYIDDSDTEEEED